jgi:hypothetical protein
MEFPDFTLENLKRLPLRAMVAFAVRCARRVEHLAQLPEGHPGQAERRVAVEAALRLAEAIARGDADLSAESVVQAIDASRQAAGAEPSCQSAAAAAAEAAHAAASVLSLIDRAVEDQNMPASEQNATARKFLGSLESTTADLAAMSAFSAADEANDAVGLNNKDFVGAFLNDYDKLVRLALGHYPEPGDPIDPSPVGPLGPFVIGSRATAAPGTLPGEHHEGRG